MLNFDYAYYGLGSSYCDFWTTLHWTDVDLAHFSNGLPGCIPENSVYILWYQVVMHTYLLRRMLGENHGQCLG